MFDEPTRKAIQQNLAGFGNALAGRGPQLNEALGALRGARRKRPAGRCATSSRRAPTSPASGEALRGALGDGRPGRRDAGEHVRRPRPHLRRLRPRLPPLHPGNDREKPADAGQVNADLPVIALPARLGPLLHRPAAGRESAGRNLAGDRRIAARRDPGRSTPRRCSTTSCSRPPKRWSTSRKRRGLQRARPADRHQQEAQASLALHRPGADRLQLLVADLQRPRNANSQGNSNGQLAQLHLVRAAGRPEQRERLRLARRPTAPERRRTISTSTPTRTPAAPGQGGVCEAGNEKYATGQTVIGNAPELWRHRQPAGRSKKKK